MTRSKEWFKHNEGVPFERKDERGPEEDLKLQFEAISRLDPEEKKVIRSVIESIILRNTMREVERRFSENGRGPNR